MTMPTRLDSYLLEHQIQFETVYHNHSLSSLHSAVEADIPPLNIAKGVVLEDHEGRHLMAVLPASSKISIAVLNEALHASYRLVKEHDVYKLFKDCEHGAIPPVGEPYHMSVVCDSTLMALDFVYLESGDHETLIKLDQKAFRSLMSHSKCMRFGHEVFH